MLVHSVAARLCSGARLLSLTPARAFAAAAAAARRFDERGLLRGATDEYYSPELDLVDAKALVEEPGALWKAAEADVAAGGHGASVDGYLQGVKARVRAFLDRKELHDRENITVRTRLRGGARGAGALGPAPLSPLTRRHTPDPPPPTQSPLRELFAGKGQLVLVLGGKSVGKSFLLSKTDKLLGAEGEATRRGSCWGCAPSLPPQSAQPPPFRPYVALPQPRSRRGC